MREIKYRQLTRDGWHYWGCFDDGTGSDFIGPITTFAETASPNKSDPYIGIKDKNGVEIYEGDIFTFTSGKKRLIGQVVFEDAMFKMRDKHGWGAMVLQEEGDMEVIGNVHENPELLGG